MAFARKLFPILVFGVAVSCGAQPKQPETARENTTEIDLGKPARERPSWPVGLVPCAKDAPEGTGCAVGSTPPAGPADAPAPAIDEKLWNVPIGPDDPMRGPADALVTLVVFSDFECPFCKRGNATLDRLLTELPKDVRLVWKDLPLSMHPHAEPAAELARFARASFGDTGFWKAHDLLYASQDSLGEPTFRRIAGQLGLPWTPAWVAIREAKFGSSIQADVALSDRVVVEATPTTFVNGIKLVGAQPYARTRALVDTELAKARSLVDAGTRRDELYAAIVSKGAQVAPHTDTLPP
ncbi:MAG TPA: DsbA family protein [Polyangiaceae bacterium]|nr:DsbA family protein [Polyangiaceae bacterium]